MYLKVPNQEQDKTKMDEKGILSTKLQGVKDLGMDMHNTNWINDAVLDASKASENLINKWCL